MSHSLLTCKLPLTSLLLFQLCFFLTTEPYGIAEEPPIALSLAEELVSLGQESYAIVLLHHKLNGEEIAANDSKGSKHHFAMRLCQAQAYFSLGLYGEVFACLPMLKEKTREEESHPALYVDDEKHGEALHLLALAAKAQGQFALASRYLEAYLKLPIAAALPSYPAIQLEMGILLFLQKEYDKAKAHLVSSEQKKPSIEHAIKTLYLARIALANHCPKQALDLLVPLQEKDSQDDPLYALIQRSIDYWMGVSHLYLHSYQEAIGFFQKSIEGLDESSPVYDKILLRLAESYAKLKKRGLQLLDMESCDEKTRKKAERFLAGNQKLTQAVNKPAKAHFLLGKYYREKAKELLNAGDKEAADDLFVKAIAAFETSFYKALPSRPHHALKALRPALACLNHLDTPSRDAQAFQLIESCMEISNEEMRDELLYFHGLFAAKLSTSSLQNNPVDYEKIAKTSLEKVIAGSSPKVPYALSQLASLHYAHKRYDLAEAAYKMVAETHLNSPLAEEALLFAACCADRQSALSQRGRIYRQRLLELYPNSSLAAEAAFCCYSCHDYLQGSKEAIKHLQHFIKTYEDSPFLLDAHYLIALDCKRSRQDAKGKSLRQQNLLATIEACYQIESLFLRFQELGKLPKNKIDYYRAMRYQTTLERGKANLAIAEASLGTKKQIFLEYAKQVLIDLLASIAGDDEAAANLPNLYPESSFWLATIYIIEKDSARAERQLDTTLAFYKEKGIVHDYFLARSLGELATLAMNREEYQKGVELLQQALDAACGGSLFSTDQKLGLYLQQSRCYCCLGRYDDALWILSQVINDECISPLRLEAMLQRADVYAAQGRIELARKQLIALQKKGGSWAIQAKEKLEKDYGY